MVILMRSMASFIIMIMISSGARAIFSLYCYKNCFTSLTKKRNHNNKVISKRKKKKKTSAEFCVMKMFIGTYGFFSNSFSISTSSRQFLTTSLIESIFISAVGCYSNGITNDEFHSFFSRILFKMMRRCFEKSFRLTRSFFSVNYRNVYNKNRCIKMKMHL